MKIVRFLKQGKVKFGILETSTLKELKYSPFARPPRQSNLERLFSGREYELESVRVLAPCLPTKIVCLGLNYNSHARELNQRSPEVPLIFMKPSTSVIGPGEEILLPRSSERVDYEGELALVIGRRAKDIPAPEANQYILGYTCINDITERNQQAKDGQWTRAKGYDTFAPLGPWIETSITPDNLLIKTSVNGAIKQSGNTSDLIFSINDIVSFISCIMTLLPGDVIATGTPQGIGRLKQGDIVEVEVEGIGTLRNRVAEAP